MVRTLLVVDDSKLARLAVAKALRTQAGWNIVEASDAESALAIASQTPPDAAVIDVNMPGRDGLELAQDLRRLRPQMPIAVVSANFQDEVVSRARRVDAVFIPKPLRGEAFGAFMGDAERALGQAG